MCEDNIEVINEQLDILELNDELRFVNGLDVLINMEDKFENEFEQFEVGEDEDNEVIGLLDKDEDVVINDELDEEEVEFDFYFYIK